MTAALDVIEVSADEHGVVRLFALKMRPEQIAFLRDEPGALAQILGLTELDMAQVDLFHTQDLEELGVAGYLTEGCGIASAELDAAMAQLAELDGPLMVLRSRAFGGVARRLTPADQVQLIASFREETSKWSARPVTTPAAQASQPRPPKLSPRAARADARRIGATLFGVVMGLFVLGLAALLF